MPDQPKKMSVVQLTLIVAVNMMGSGIIMLPANMAQIGAISLLSWIVTSIGSMAIAYGFAQAGIFNQRAGGLAAYAEDAYGKDGYFQVFFLYFLATAIANVAIASSALGYIAAFFPVLTSTPIASGVGVIGILWLTTIANFGGPRLTGKIGSASVWGVLLPVGFISFGGWFWFSSSTFAAAWNPQGLSLVQGMGSSISLTLWAYLGMESAAQNGSAVENPKRDVPLACMFGTLGAGVIYILSTTVIQGIVPNAELAQSTGPFGLAFAHMFNPQVGSIVMALASIACVGSLLGWQFVLVQTAKDAADSRMFPRDVRPDQSHGSADRGHDHHGSRAVADGSVHGLTHSEQAVQHSGRFVGGDMRGALHHRPVRAASDDAQCPHRAAVIQRNLLVAVIAMLYSVYSLYAAGKDAVMGGMVVMALGFVLFGLLAPRFVAAPASTPSAKRCILT